MSQAEGNTTRVRRARTFHRPARIWWVSLFHLLSWITIAGFLAMGVALAVTRDHAFGIFSLVLLMLFLVTRGLAFILSRHLFCTLCMGKVMSEMPCNKHVNAQRLRPLTYRATAVLAVLFTLSFRCMYCGTRFRLWK